MENISKQKFEEAMVLVKDLDFTLAIKKLQTENAGGWTEDRAIKAVEGYKRYLAITKALDGFQLVPNADIDEIWHYHIMDTRRYEKDCQDIFGGFLHHYPYYGMLDEENEKNWKENQVTSNNIWNELFNEELYESSYAPNCPQACPCNKDENNNGIDYNYKKAS
jgi:hypothetical protein